MGNHEFGVLSVFQLDSTALSKIGLVHPELGLQQSSTTEGKKKSNFFKRRILITHIESRLSSEEGKGRRKTDGQN